MQIPITEIQIIVLIVFGSILLFCLVLELKKGGKNNFFKNPLVLEVSKDFQKDLEILIVEETKKNLLAAKEKVLQEHEKNTKKYKELFERLEEDLESKNKEIEESFLLFSQKIDEETSKLQKISREIQDKISREAERKIIDELTQGFEETHSQVSSLLLNETKNRVEELTKGLTKEISSVYASAQTTLEKEIQLTKKEIEDYKIKKMKDLDEKIYLIAGKTAKKILGKTIDLSTHEELVMDALEKAKKEIF